MKKIKLQEADMVNITTPVSAQTSAGLSNRRESEIQLNVTRVFHGIYEH